MIDHEETKAFLKKEGIPFRVITRGDNDELTDEIIEVNLKDLTEKQIRLVTTYGE